MKDAQINANRSKAVPPEKGRRMIVLTDRGDGGLFAFWRRLSGIITGLRGFLNPLHVSREWASATENGARYSGADVPIQIAELARKLSLAEAALASNARAVALTSHELRTPLNGILGMVDLLARTPLSHEQASYVQAINSSAAALLALVDDMLDAGKLAAGRWDINPQPVAIEALVEEVVELLAPQAQAKGLELAAHVSAHTPEKVGADPNLIVRILMNLIGNAIKFTEVGGVAIEVVIEEQTDHDVTLAFIVSDSGIGIADNDRARIFGEYEQADTGLSRKSSGTGLGLAISRAIARALGGDITVDSTEGRGSTFRVILRLPILSPAMPAPRPFSGGQILLVSDQSVGAPILMRRLFDLGASVQWAKTTDEANIALKSARTFDALLVDHSTHLDAVSFCRTLAEQRRPFAVMITPAERPVLHQIHAFGQIQAFGLANHLIKPIRGSSLNMILSVLLTGARLAPGASPAIVGHPAPPRSKLSILLVDDNDINVLLGVAHLQSMGHHVESVKSGRDAISNVRKARADGHPYDAILMDLHMPELDGFAAISAIRSDETLFTGRTLILALTADLTEHSADRAIAAGADHVITKPIDTLTLANLLATTSPSTTPSRGQPPTGAGSGNFHRHHRGAS